MLLSFPNTYRGISSMAFSPAPLTFAQGQRMTAEPSALAGGGGGGGGVPLP